MQHPHLGKMVSPAMEIATGTSSLQGTAAEQTRQQACTCALRTERPSFSHLSPKHIKGNRQGAPGLQQHSALQQQIPAYNSKRRIGKYHRQSELHSSNDSFGSNNNNVVLTFPEQPKQSHEGRTEQFTQQSAQQRMSSSSLTASSMHMVSSLS
jgi:hypothetical protein